MLNISVSFLRTTAIVPAGTAESVY